MRPTGFTLMGIQTAAYEDGRFLFGIYGGKGNPAGVIEVDGDFTGYVRYTGAGSEGILRLNGMYYLGVAGRDPETRGNIHRAAEENESLAFCFPGTPESVAADRELSAVLAAIRNEAISLGVSVVE